VLTWNGFARDPYASYGEPASYGGRVRGLLFYTVSRVLLFIAVWLIVQFVTPLRGLMALVVALLVSGAIAFFVLNRQRDSASASVVGLFRRIDDRIERARTAEDGHVDTAGGTPTTAVESDAAEHAEPTEPPDDHNGPNTNPEPRSTP